jgi:deoxyribonucleoside regulator
MMEDSHDDAVRRVAELYYFDGLTETAIGDRLGCTRWSVGRLLEEARRRHLVTVTINDPLARRHDLESELCSRFALRAAMVVPTQPTTGATLELVIRSAVAYLTGLRPRPRSLGIGWGRTMAMLARCIPWNWSCGIDVYQLNGGIARSPRDLVSTAVGELARRTRGTPHWVPAPTIVANGWAWDTVMHEPIVSTTLRDARTAEVTVYSPGSVGDDSLMVRLGYLSAREIPNLLDSGASADVLSHLVTADGTAASDDLEARTVSFPISGLTAGQTVIAVGCGPRKASAFRSVLSGRLASVAVLDSETALKVLGNMS